MLQLRDDRERVFAHHSNRTHFAGQQLGTYSAGGGGRKMKLEWRFFRKPDLRSPIPDFDLILERGTALNSKNMLQLRYLLPLRILLNRKIELDFPCGGKVVGDLQLELHNLAVHGEVD